MRLHNIFFCTLLLVIITQGRRIPLRASEISETDLENAIRAWDRSEPVDKFNEIINAFILPDEFRSKDWRKFTGERAAGICTICKSGVNLLMSYRKDGLSDADIMRKLTKTCTLLNFQKEHICRGMVELNAPIIMHILDAKPNLTADTFCGVIFESGPCYNENSEFDWTIKIDQNPPLPVIKGNNNEIVKILHITDIHYDPKYEPYGNPDCGEPCCCRVGQNFTNKGVRVAGYWGDYSHCDSPWHAVEDALDHIKETHHDLSYIYFTGDIIDHGVWETGKNGNVDVLNKTYTKIHETFKDLPVFPVFGNHESHPPNVFAPNTIVDHNLSMEWLYTTMANIWIGYGWLPESTRSTILQGGFYTVSPKPGFRIIGLNNNVCYPYNWWILYKPKDPNGQLQWLANILSQAEKDGEFVHILTHIPPGDNECQSTWVREFIKIINRYSNIITGQFNGHTHSDELRIIYDSDDYTNPTHIAWNGGSTTTFADLNPNYKIYTANVNDFAVEDYDNWMYNLTAANITPDQRPKWFKSYSFKEKYGISELTLNSLNQWITRMISDDVMSLEYYKNFIKYADTWLKLPCDNSCVNSYICRIRVSANSNACK